MFLRRDHRPDHAGDLHQGWNECSTSYWSTMPTTPASAGTSAGWNGKLASLPRTKNTVSPTPAPTASTATSVRPTAVPSAVIGCTTRSVRLARFSSLRVTTTLPMTLASCTSGMSFPNHHRPRRCRGRLIAVECLLWVVRFQLIHATRSVPRGDFDRVDDADDGGVDGA